jgi:hypothetical protein
MNLLPDFRFNLNSRGKKSSALSWRANLHARFAPCQRSEASRIDRFFALWVWENIAQRSALCAIFRLSWYDPISSQARDIITSFLCAFDSLGINSRLVRPTTRPVHARKVFVLSKWQNIIRGAMTFAKSEGGRTGLTCGVRALRNSSLTLADLYAFHFPACFVLPVCFAPRTFNRDILWDYDANGNKKMKFDRAKTRLWVLSVRFWWNFYSCLKCMMCVCAVCEFQSLCDFCVGRSWREPLLSADPVNTIYN